MDKKQINEELDSIQEMTSYYNNLRKISPLQEEINQREGLMLSLLANAKPIKKSKSTTTIDEYKTIYEHMDLTRKPIVQKDTVAVTFIGAKFPAGTDLDRAKFILGEAIEKYTNFRPMIKIDIQDFVKFVNDTFKIELLELQDIELELVDVNFNEKHLHDLAFEG